MSHWVAYSLLVFPFILRVIFNKPLDSLWKLRHPHEVMTARFASVAFRFDNCLPVLLNITLIGILMTFAIGQNISHDLVGLRLSAWPINVVIGAAVAMIVLTAKRRYYAKRASRDLPFDYAELSKGPVLSWLIKLLLEAFAQEYWIVLGLVVLTRLGHSSLYSVLITAIVSGIGHVLLGVEAVPLFAIDVLPSCFLFLWRASIIPQLVFHWMGNVAILYWQRRGTFEDIRSRVSRAKLIERRPGAEYNFCRNPDGSYCLGCPFCKQILFTDLKSYDVVIYKGLEHRGKCPGRENRFNHD